MQKCQKHYLLFLVKIYDHSFSLLELILIKLSLNEVFITLTLYKLC